ncbi:WD repeat-containing protein 55-like [Chenopodium quinoa]|uniref:WD repeat-containing protein 55-like n=1 Tax=Chenopodium quinoa TaxID=63459 RepID=UPI000B771651|nr:WD repeat-containing protein 55-like [Chenopodium quinoa]
MEIKLGDHPFDVDFHPSDSLVATGLINGYLLLYRYAAEAEPQRLLNVRAHKKSCRTTRFINEGRAIVTGSADCSILATDVETGAKIAHLKNAHTDAVNSIINLTEATIASGDDSGCVKLWDTRQQSCCHTFQVHEEYISDMTFASDSLRLLATSGDGTLSVCSIRSNKVQAQSEFCEDEPLSVVIMKNGRKVICGTQSGTLLLYSWGFFKDCSDRFVDLSPNSVDALLKYDEDRLITGSSNGLISLVGILPNRIIQPIAEHSEYPVERLAFSHDKKLLGSISHDNTLKLWDMDELLQGPSTVTRNDTAADSNSDSDSDGMDVDSDLANASRGTKRKNTGTGNGKASSSSFGSFFEGL